MDPESEAWVAGLSGVRGDHEAKVAELHRLLLGVAIAEASRRYGVNGITGLELDDLAHQAAADAVVSILAKFGDFRGESRFTTWAYKFAVYEVSNKFGRHVWRREAVRWEPEYWERLPDRLGVSPEQVTESRELVDTVQAAVMTKLTEYQRRVFIAILVNGTPLDVLALELGTSRQVLYKALSDARRRLREHLVEQGYLEGSPGRER